MRSALRIGGSATKYSGVAQTAECSPCCEQVDCTWFQVESCECAKFLFVCAPVGYFSCDIGDGRPFINNVLRMTSGQPGRCWKVIDYWDEPPPDAEIVSHTSFDPECLGTSCNTAPGCVSYEGDCPGDCCGYEVCDGLQTSDPNRCDYVTRVAVVQKSHILTNIQVFAQWDMDRIAVNSPLYPPGTEVLTESATLTGGLTVYTRYVHGDDPFCETPMCEYNEMRLDATIVFRSMFRNTGGSVQENNDSTTLSVVIASCDPFQTAEAGCSGTTIGNRIHGAPVCGHCFSISYPSLPELFLSCPWYNNFPGESEIKNRIGFAIAMATVQNGCIGPDEECEWDDVVVLDDTDTFDTNGCGSSGVINRITDSGRYKRWGASDRTREALVDYQQVDCTAIGGGVRVDFVTNRKLVASVQRQTRVLHVPCPPSSTALSRAPVIAVATPLGAHSAIEEYLSRDPMHRCKGCGG